MPKFRVKKIWDGSNKELAPHDYRFIYENLTMELEEIPDPKKWEPEPMESYFYVHADGGVRETSWNGQPVDHSYLEHGNCFQSRELAEAAAERVKLALKGEGV